MNFSGNINNDTDDLSLVVIWISVRNQEYFKGFLKDHCTHKTIKILFMHRSISDSNQRKQLLPNVGLVWYLS